MIVWDTKKQICLPCFSLKKQENNSHLGTRIWVAHSLSGVFVVTRQKHGGGGGVGGVEGSCLSTYLGT